jgi:hypothetical protein
MCSTAGIKSALPKLSLSGAKAGGEQIYPLFLTHHFDKNPASRVISSHRWTQIEHRFENKRRPIPKNFLKISIHRCESVARDFRLFLTLPSHQSLITYLSRRSLGGITSFWRQPIRQRIRDYRRSRYYV